MLRLLRYLAGLLGYELIEGTELADVRRLAKDPDGKKVQQLNQFRQFVEGGECRYALVAIDGGNAGKFWPINVNDVVAGVLQPSHTPDDWRGYIEDLRNARVLVVPLFLAERLAQPNGSLESIGIQTPASIDMVGPRPD